MAYVNIIVDICHFGCYAWYKGCQKPGGSTNGVREAGRMPRQKKCRKVCQMPAMQEFRPVGSARRRAAVILSVDEYEAIRLIDKQGFSQEECGRYMQVARTTVQMIYNSARKKLAEALVEGLPLRIEGGDYRLCDGKEEYCGCGGCRRHRRRPMPGMQSVREEKDMRIAAALDKNKEDVCTGDPLCRQNPL